MNKGVANAFLGFEVIFSLVLCNILIIFGSVISLGVLFPVLLTATMNYIKRFYTYKEYQGILFTFFGFIKGNIKRTFLILAPLTLIIAFLLFNIFYLNQILFELFPVYVIIIVYGVQIFVFYQLLGILLHVTVELTKQSNHTLKQLYVHGFLIFNLHPIRSFFSIFSFFVIGATALMMVDYLYFVFIPVALFAFYIVNAPLLENEKDFIKN